MENIHEIIDVTIDMINTMTELFYQQKTNEAIAGMNALLDSILIISEVIAKNDGIMEEEKSKLVLVLNAALEAMQQADYVLLADILKYDMNDVLIDYKNMI